MGREPMAQASSRVPGSMINDLSRIVWGEMDERMIVHNEMRCAHEYI